MYMFLLSTSEGRANVKHFAVLIGGGDVSMNVDGTIHNAKLAADDGIEIFALGKLIPMSASLIVVRYRITVFTLMLNLLLF